MIKLFTMPVASLVLCGWMSAIADEVTARSQVAGFPALGRPSAGGILQCRLVNQESYQHVLEYAAGSLNQIHDTDHLRFHYRAAIIEQPKLVELAARFERVYLSIRERLDLRFDDRISVYLYPRRFQGALWRALPCLSRFNSDEVHVHYLGPSEHGHIEHEMVHVMSEHLHAFGSRGVLPALLVEGLAEYIVGDPWGIALDEWVRGIVDAGEYVSIGHLNRTDVFRSTNQVVAYEEAGSFVSFLIEEYGLELFKTLYAQPLYLGIYGQSLGQLERRWKQHIASTLVSDAARELIQYRLREGEQFASPEGLESRVWVGIRTKEIDGRLVIEAVEADSPASRGRLKPGDVLVRFGTEDVRPDSAWKIAEFLQSKQSGESIDLVIVRDGTNWPKTLTLAQDPNWRVD